MTFYDWENIVKNKSISELKQIVRDNHLGEDAFRYAKIELEKRLENEKDPTEKTIDTCKKSIKRIANVVGIYQLVGGVLGLGLIFNLLLIAQLDFKTIVILMVDVVVVLISIFAGILLLTKKKRNGLSWINQYLQIFHIKSSVLTFSYFSGGAIFLGISFEPTVRFVFNPLGIFTKLEFYWLNEIVVNESFIYINVLSFVVLYYLSKMNGLIKKEKNAEALTKNIE